MPIRFLLPLVFASLLLALPAEAMPTILSGSRTVTTNIDCNGGGGDRITDFQTLTAPTPLGGPVTSLDRSFNNGFNDVSASAEASVTAGANSLGLTGQAYTFDNLFVCAGQGGGDIVEATSNIVVRFELSAAADVDVAASILSRIDDFDSSTGEIKLTDAFDAEVFSFSGFTPTPPFFPLMLDPGIYEAAISLRSAHPIVNSFGDDTQGVTASLGLSFTIIPELGTFTLVGLGTFALASHRRRHR